MKDQYRVFWNGTQLSKGEPTGFSEMTTSDGPSVSVSATRSGFKSVLARPEESNRTIALSLEESPEPGSYTFTPSANDYDIEVRLEYEQEPFPDPNMHTLTLSSELCDTGVGDDVVIGLRKDTTECPGVKEIQGTAVEVVDSSGVVPDASMNFIDYSESPMISILVDFSDQDIEDVNEIDPYPMLSHRIDPHGGSRGTLDVVGTSEPFEVRWEGASDTAALHVEYVTVEPERGDCWTVANDSLPDVQFSPLREFAHSERVNQLASAFNRSELSLSDEVLDMFASVVEDEPPEVNITVEYESKKSGELLSKSGVLESVRSVYYADPNRARHQIRFKDTTSFYIRVDPHADATSPIGVYSKAYNRHWDTDLGEVRNIEVSGPDDRGTSPD